ncbi:MAG: hypothetical protein RMH77_04910 [Sulfolobales archaeon]|nr:hypothetical protein [Sulfolobales archaeon]MCX8186704.1 hypothetical protein [Sulfolobales archaeon]MDW7969724.1 hypothetical protein [Sulfolobales archaeon]
MVGSPDLKQIVDTLDRHFSIINDEFIAYHLCRCGYSSFEVLVSIILSQNTRDDLAIKAFNNLKVKLGTVTPEAILSLPISDVEEALRIAGLFRRKSRVIYSIAKAVKDLGGVDALNSLPGKELREALLNIDGIGYKTVDVFMLMCRGIEVFPIDTHIRRVLARLGITGRRDNYLKIQAKVHEVLPPNYYLKAHLLLIKLGRSYCRARKPLCSTCPIDSVCLKRF